jgi:hypothetical protein
MPSAQRMLTPKASLLLLLLCLFAFVGTAVQAVQAHRVAATTIEAYAPKNERQAVAFIIEAVPSGDQREKAVYLAQALATSVQSQYEALSHSVERQASALTYQTLVWAAASILALVALLESRRPVASAA